MADTSGRPLFDHWQNLVARWEIAYAHYVDAVEARNKVLALGGTVGDIGEIEKRALANLNEIKSEMSTLLVAEGRSRGEIKDSLVVGTINREPDVQKLPAPQTRKDTGQI
jgi:hypothetical protein